MCSIYFGFTSKTFCKLWYFKIFEYVEYWTQSQTNEVKPCFNIVHGNAPLCMKKSFTLVSSSYRNARTVDNMNFTIPYIKSCQDQTFYYDAIKDWNALPSSIKQIDNKCSFKRSVKKNILWIASDNMMKVLMCTYDNFIAFYRVNDRYRLF